MTQMFALVMLSALVAALLARAESCPVEEATGDLNECALKGYKARVELLLRQGVDVDRRGRSQGTPLMAAAFMGHADIVRLLLARGADVSARSESGATALDAARFAHQAECVKLLLGAGVSSKKTAPTS